MDAFALTRQAVNIDDKVTDQTQSNRNYCNTLHLTTNNSVRGKRELMKYAIESIDDMKDEIERLERDIATRKKFVLLITCCLIFYYCSV